MVPTKYQTYADKEQVARPVHELLQRILSSLKKLPAIITFIVKPVAAFRKVGADELGKMSTATE